MQTKYIVWEKNKGFNQGDLQQAKKVIETGGLVAFPTETVYGLGGNALREDASRRIYEAKGRPSDNPLIVHISNQKMLYPLVSEIPKNAELLMDAFWPGPLTLIFHKSNAVPKGTTGGLDTVAIRMPEHECAIEFLEYVAVPIAAPSANVSGRPSPTKASHVKEDLDGRIDMIIDGGAVGIGIESTIIDMTSEVPTILRPGYITNEMIAKVIGKVEIDPGLTLESGVQPKAPGMKYRHYAPKGDMTIFEGAQEDVIKHINQLASNYPADEVGILTTEESKDRYTLGHIVCVGSRREETISKELYCALRQFDELDVKVIFSESFLNESHGEAIMNRLRKAAGHKVVVL